MGEIRSLSVKATRGAGFDWGLAEEAGFAVEWLERHGMPGVAALSRYLSDIDDGVSTDDLGSTLAVGALISDTQDWERHLPLSCSQPLLLAPFLANVCGDGVLVMTVGTDLDPESANTEDGSNALAPALQKDSSYKLIVSQTNVKSTDAFITLAAGYVSVSRESAEEVSSVEGIAKSRPNQTRVHENRLPYVETLTHFAHRTYAPATEESRLSGAGAGVRDDD